jgi:hypothetical protein
MKVTIEFDNKAEALNAMQGEDWHDAMYNLDQKLMRIVKHGYIGNREATECEMECFDKCREMLREAMEDNDITFDL